MHRIHADGLGGIAVSGGVAVIDFTQFATLPDGKANPKMETAQRLSMNLDTMLRLHQALTGAVSQLEDKGVIQKKDAQKVTKQ